MTISFSASPIHRQLLLLTAAIGLSVPAAAQSSSEKAVEAEIDFARGLAKEWAFVDMAESVLNNVAEKGVSGRMESELELVRCDVYYIGAKASTDPTRRNELFEQAMSAYEDYVTANMGADNRIDAQRTMVELASFYARSLDISLEEAVGEEAEALRERKVAVLEKSVRLCEELIEEIDATDPMTPALKTKRDVLMLDKAGLYAHISSATPDDAFFSEQAIETYSELIFDVGEGTEIALRANAGIGDVYASTGFPEEARDFYIGVINSVIPIDPDKREEMLEWSKLPLDIKQKRFLYVELVIPGVQSTSRELGELEGAITAGLFFYNLYRQEGFSLSVLGNSAMLEFASTLVDAGGFIGGDLGEGSARWFATEAEMREEVKSRRQQRDSITFALDLAKQIASDNPGTEAARKGGELIASINERPGIEIPPAQLLQAADAKRAGENYEEALAGYRELLTRLDALDPADRVEFGAKVYNGMGLTLRRQDRQLEAAMAFREALLNWRDDDFNRSNARGYQNTIKAWARGLGIDNQDDVAALIREAENFVIAFDEEGSADEIIFNRGEARRSDRDWDGAIAEYEQIKPEDGFYELAQIQIGLCKLSNKDLRGARGAFDDYLTGRAKDPKFTPTSPLEEARRSQALSRAEFYRAYIDHVIANGRYRKSEGADDSGFAKVIEELKDYGTTYGNAGKFVIRAQSILADSYAKSGDAASAAAIVAEMVASSPDAPETASASIDLYLALNARRDRMEAAGVPDPNAYQKVTGEMAKALEFANGITPSPEFKNLRAESKLWLELQEWQKAKSPLERMASRFKDDAEYGRTVATQVTPDLAECLVELGEMEVAKNLLAPLIVGEDAPLKSRRPTLLLSRAMLGSVNGGGGGERVTATRGAGGTEEEFQFITGRLNTFAMSGDKWWACDWYEAKFMSIYAYYVWGLQDDRKAASAKRIMDEVVVTLENDVQFSVVEENCSGEETEPALRARLGNGVLAARYRWLYEQTR
ncbi:MAG: hypothetical protein ISQ11_10810 [Planctomycetes bacterium]|nr:hypothetical protein [Planctomycetota bacterium]